MDYFYRIHASVKGIRGKAHTRKAVNTCEKTKQQTHQIAASLAFSARTPNANAELLRTSSSSSCSKAINQGASVSTNSHTDKPMACKIY